MQLPDHLYVCMYICTYVCVVVLYECLFLSIGDPTDPGLCLCHLVGACVVFHDETLSKYDLFGDMCMYISRC